MICKPCRDQDHEACKAANADKQPSSCDCQHRVKQETIVLPDSMKLGIEKVFAKE